MAQAFDPLSPSDTGGNSSPPFPTKPPSFDFRGQRELEWDEIQIALHAIDIIAVEVEMLGRCAVDSIHSEKLDEVFASIRADLEGQVADLKANLGLAREVQS